MARGDIHEITCRNLVVGVEQRDGWYVGIRQKFDSRYLFAEYVFPQAVGPKIGRVPDDVPIEEYLGSVDLVTGREVASDLSLPRGEWPWYFKDTGEFDKAIEPGAVRNQRLFDILEPLDDARWKVIAEERERQGRT